MAEGDKARVLARDPLFSLARYASFLPLVLPSSQPQACAITPPPLLQADVSDVETFAQGTKCGQTTGLVYSQERHTPSMGRLT